MTQPPESPYGQPYPQQPTPQQPAYPPPPDQSGYAAPPPPPQYGQQPPMPYGGQPPYGAYPGAPVPGAPGPGKGLAITAFVLSILGFFFLTALVSIVLAIIALVRRAGGRGLAIAALVISVLWVLFWVIIVVVAAFAPSDKPDPVRGPDGHVTKPQQIEILAIKQGDCFDDPALFNAASGGAGSGTTVNTTTVKVVPCSTAHEFEYYASIDVSDEGDTYPGDAALGQRADTECASAFTTFVGKSPADSIYAFTHYVPQAGIWALKSQRRITCVIGNPKSETTGSLAGIDK